MPPGDLAYHFVTDDSYGGKVFWMFPTFARALAEAKRQGNPPIIFRGKRAEPIWKLGLR
jgi:hypothetical protein